jgi:hypothetical protein
MAGVQITQERLSAALRAIAMDNGELARSAGSCSASTGPCAKVSKPLHIAPRI